MRKIIRTLKGLIKAGRFIDPPEEPTKLTIPEAVKRVNSITGFSASDLQGKKKNTQLVAARALFSLVCRKGAISEMEICNFLNKDRTTLVHYRTDYKPTRNYRQYYDIYEKKFGRIQ